MSGGSGSVYIDTCPLEVDDVFFLTLRGFDHSTTGFAVAL